MSAVTTRLQKQFIVDIYLITMCITLKKKTSTIYSVYIF